jgi:hypothetical protein
MARACRRRSYLSSTGSLESRSTRQSAASSQRGSPALPADSVPAASCNAAGSNISPTTPMSTGSSTGPVAKDSCPRNGQFPNRRLPSSLGRARPGDRRRCARRNHAPASGVRPLLHRHGGRHSHRRRVRHQQMPARLRDRIWLTTAKLRRHPMHPLPQSMTRSHSSRTPRLRRGVWHSHAEELVTQGRCRFSLPHPACP